MRDFHPLRSTSILIEAVFFSRYIKNSGIRRVVGGTLLGLPLYGQSIGVNTSRMPIHVLKRENKLLQMHATLCYMYKFTEDKLLQTTYYDR